MSTIVIVCVYVSMVFNILKIYLKRCCDEIGVTFDMNEIDRVHYIRTPAIDTDSRQKVRSIIVKFQSWES